ncbi:AAA family ATPase [uncultured Oscillibacter sp.]|uniref:AAA family ATPase n=1 Tax=uncultured Oscillibacter sp. TaxID=876091 RepID=UPI0025D97149|nr:AAA family ATPase [uncultured Oscillibacter sp.]
MVDTLISQGLHILAGFPKVGKSWLALWLAVTVAKGEPVWGMQVEQGTTLYLCLEDSHLRIQNRLFDVTEDAPPNVHFCMESQILGDGLAELRPKNFRDIYTELRKQISQNTGEPLSEYTVEGVHACLCGILSDAMESGFINHNPAWLTKRLCRRSSRRWRTRASSTRPITS